MTTGSSPLSLAEMMAEIPAPASPERFVPARVDPREIGFLNALIEGHEGIATMRTLDQSRGLVLFWVSEGQWADFERMFEELQREIALVRVDPADPVLRGLNLQEWKQD